MLRMLALGAQKVVDLAVQDVLDLVLLLEVERRQVFIFLKEVVLDDLVSKLASCQHLL